MMQMDWESIGFFFVVGFIMTPIAGMLFSWVDRKVTARVQWRVGPPLLQPFWDFVKLLGKETLIPSESAKTLFLPNLFSSLKRNCDENRKTSEQSGRQSSVFAQIGEA